MRIVVLGIGNILLSDEGVGVHAVTAFERRYRLPPEIDVVDGGTAGIELIGALAHADHLVIVDAARLGQPPGHVSRLSGDQIPAFFRTRLSPHQVGLSDLLATLQLTGEAPGRVVLIGVQPASLGTGMELSETVAGRLDEIVALLVAEIEGLGLRLTPRLQ